MSARRTRRQGEVARAARRFRGNVVSMVALVFVALVAVVGLFHRFLAPYDPALHLNVPPFSPPSAQHWLGSDGLGRDTFSRILEGAGVSLQFSLLVVALALVVAVPIGLVSGYVGRGVDVVLMRVMEAIHSFPAMVLAIAIVAMLGPSLVNAGIAVAIGAIPNLARLTRAQALAVREEVFVDASRAIGTSTGRILRRHLLPNVLSPVIVQSSVFLGFALLAEAGLSFLGLGVQPPQASWGSMLRQATDTMLTRPWEMLPPGLAIALTVLAFNLVGEGMRSALAPVPPTGRRGMLGVTTVRRGADEVRPATRSAGGVEPLLVVDRLAVEFSGRRGDLRVLDDVSFSIAPGETLGLVGESGSGKTVTSMSIMRLLPAPPARIVGGGIWFGGRDVLSMSFDDMVSVRGSEIAMIFQDPMASLNPAMTVGRQISEVVRWHRGTSRQEADALMRESLELVGIPGRRAQSYPHEFSGGMRQRAVIAMALVCRPKLLIADEPTTALDVTIQAQVLELLRDLRSELGMAMLFVTHDLGVVADICQRVAVMYAGQIVETGTVDEVFRTPRHPYTSGLLRAMPQQAAPREELYVIPGSVPDFASLSGGCRLASRCAFVQDSCTESDVPLVTAGDEHFARCTRVAELDLAVGT